jgi:hypothetical protein
MKRNISVYMESNKNYKLIIIEYGDAVPWIISIYANFDKHLPERIKIFRMFFEKNLLQWR